MNNEGIVRYQDDKLYFQLGSLNGNSLQTNAELSTEVEAMILDKLNSDDTVTLSLAQILFTGGGAGNYGASFTCSIDAV